MSKVNLSVSLGVSDEVQSVVDRITANIGPNLRLQIAALGSDELEDGDFEERFEKAIKARKWPGRGIRQIKANIHHEDLAYTLTRIADAKSGYSEKAWQRLANAAVAALTKLKTAGSQILAAAEGCQSSASA